jgi:hypothetical protein
VIRQLDSCAGRRVRLSVRRRELSSPADITTNRAGEMASLVAVNRPRTPGPMSSGQVVGRRIVFAVRWRRMDAY